MMDGSQPSPATDVADVVEMWVSSASGSASTPVEATSPGSMGPPPRPLNPRAPVLRGGIRPTPGGSYASSFDDADRDSDWSEYGDVPDVLEEYDRVAQMLDGSENWNVEQCKVHKLIYMRGIHPMIPSWWRMSFKMWGMAQPQLDHLFTPAQSKKRVVISALGNEVAAAKALESLFYISQTVSDYEEIGYQEKIGPTVVKAISSYIKWALRDAEIDKLLPPLFVVHSYTPDFTGEDEDVWMSEYDDEEYKDDGGTSTEENSTPISTEQQSEEDISRITADEEERRFTRALERNLETRMRTLGQQWRDFLRVNGPKGRRPGYQEHPPTLYGFAVVQHMVMLVSHDASRANNQVVVLEQIPLNDRGQWLWNALSLAIPINVAKRSAVRLDQYARKVKLYGVSEQEEEEDPDL